MDVVNPATLEVLDVIPDDDAASVVAKRARADAARREQQGWAGHLEERIEAVRGLRERVVDRFDELAELLTAETGKPITQARNELTGVLPRLDFFVDHVAGVVAPVTVLDDEDHGLREEIAWEPLGTVANISAWNYPWFVGTNVFVPALLTGNAVLYKPSEHASLTGRVIAGLWSAAGVPDGFFQAVFGAGDVGRLVLDGVQGVFFTGSYATGRRIAEAVAEAGSTARVQLELGGKDPVFVADDADVAIAAESLADGAFYNAGQSCCAVERIYVHHRVHDAFVDAFVAAVEAFRVGDPRDPDTYLGPLTRPQQADLLDAQVADALARGAGIATGGGPVADPPGRGTWYRPTVLTGVTGAMAVMRDESFGPVIGIQAVRSDEEATVEMAATEYGLTAGVYTPDERRARAVLERLEVGSAYWNCCDRVSPHLPWTGRRHSGTGSTLSTLGIQAFVQPKAWHLLRHGDA
jgi:acyl-CoA reductase-like NAD-dependent aldehyde dehydrogenase